MELLLQHHSIAFIELFYSDQYIFSIYSEVSVFYKIVGVCSKSYKIFNSVLIQLLCLNFIFSLSTPIQSSVNDARNFSIKTEKNAHHFNYSTYILKYSKYKRSCLACLATTIKFLSNIASQKYLL